MGRNQRGVGKDKGEVGWRKNYPGLFQNLANGRTRGSFTKQIAIMLFGLIQERQQKTGLNIGIYEEPPQGVMIVATHHGKPPADYEGGEG